jgi:hypothetical protein
LVYLLAEYLQFFQYQKPNKKAEFLNELSEKIRTDKDIRDSIYLIDYEKDWYNQFYHNGCKMQT